MAEIRKHKPGSTGAIGDQVREAVGSGPRPIDPRTLPSPRFDPFHEADDPAPAATAPGFAAVGLGTDGWFSFDPQALGAALKASGGEDAAGPATGGAGPAQQ